MNFVAQKKSLTNIAMLELRIQNLRMHVSFIQDAKKQDGKILTKLHHILSSKKQQQPRGLTVSEHTQFYPPSSDGNDSADFEVANVTSSDLVAEEMKQPGSSNKKRKGESRNH